MNDTCAGVCALLAVFPKVWVHHHRLEAVHVVRAPVLHFQPEYGRASCRITYDSCGGVHVLSAVTCFQQRHVASAFVTNCLFAAHMLDMQTVHDEGSAVKARL
jgi:hypothetical protein